MLELLLMQGIFYWLLWTIVGAVFLFFLICCIAATPFAIFSTKREKKKWKEDLEKLEEYRKSKGLSIEEMAKKLGVARETYWKWKIGEMEPSKKERMAIESDWATYLGKQENITKKRGGTPFCLKCGYDLVDKNIEEKECPNCGSKLNEENIGYLRDFWSSFREVLFRKRKINWMTVSIIFFILLDIILGIFAYIGGEYEREAKRFEQMNNNSSSDFLERLEEVYKATRTPEERARDYYLNKLEKTLERIDEIERESNREYDKIQRDLEKQEQSLRYDDY